MTVAQKHQSKRTPLKARPRPEVDAATVTAEASRAFPRTLEYLGR